MEIKFPNKLRSYRRYKGYSLKKVARILGYANTSTVAKWERGVAAPSLVQVFRLARIYGIDVHLLYDELWESVESEVSLLVQDTEPNITN